jgi:polysaccharide export outer membrane protein
MFSACGAPSTFEHSPSQGLPSLAAAPNLRDRDSIGREAKRGAGKMKTRIRRVGCAAVGLLAWQCCSAAFGQSVPAPDGSRLASISGLTGTGAGSSSSKAANPGRADGTGNPLLGGRHPLYRLRPTDVVQISFTVAPEFDQTLTVQPDGYVMLKDVGMVEVEGLNLEEFVRAVQKAYEGYLHDPQVAAALKDFEHPYFVIGGQVAKPGKYELRSDTTVAEAVQIAGGLIPQSKSSQVVLFRRVNDDLVQTQLLNLKQMLKHGQLREDAHLQPGDLVFVPQNFISKIAPFLTRPSASMYVNLMQF